MSVSLKYTSVLGGDLTIVSILKDPTSVPAIWSTVLVHFVDFLKIFFVDKKK